jgi:glycosyltransferase involved in cell wall biosynthesis
MLSVIIPARNEPYLEKTIRNVLENARGEIEIIILLDGYLPDPKIDIGDARVIFYPFEQSIGQRQCINFGVVKAHGEFLMKLDAHCAVDEGFDAKLAADCEYDWTAIPRMYNLDIATWKPKLHKRTDYMHIGLRPNGELRTEYYGGQEFKRQHAKPDLIDDTMSCMGPCFFMHRQRFLDLGGCDEHHGGWGQQGIEVACKAWLSGGRLVVNKKTWFAHWFRGGGGPGFPYQIGGRDVEAARKYSKDLWLNDKWPQATRKFEWLLEKFNPPGWEKRSLIDDQENQQIALVGRKIREVFSVRTRGDFSPIGSRRGTRGNLPEIWRDAGYRVGVEIGVQRGVYSSHILRTMPDVHLHSIDPWAVYGENKSTAAAQERNYSIAMERLKPFIDEGRCTVHREFSQKMVNLLEDESLDFVFIDGDHTFNACAMDLINYVPKVRRGGMVAVHDYLPMRKGGVIEAVDGFTKCNLIAPWFVIREALPTAFWVKA